MRLIIILLLSFCLSQAAFAKAKKVSHKSKSKTKVTRVVTLKKSKAKKQIAQNKTVAKKPKKMSETARKALAKRQVEHARKIAGRQKREQAPPEFRANHEVTIKDFGFEQTPPTAEETAVMTATVTSEELKLDNGTTPYIDGTAVYVERDTASADEAHLASDFDIDFEE